MSKFRNFVFTKNNYTDSDVDAIKSFDCSYIVFGYEVAPTTGTPHLQGYCELHNPRSINVLSKVFGHIAKRMGTAKQAADYCTKGSNFYERGRISGQGHRSDLETISSMILDTKCSLEQVALDHPGTYIKFYKGIEKLKSISLVDRVPDLPPKIEWLWGLSGTGKTRTCIESHSSYYIKDGTMWWDGYTQQEAIIIDDFDGKWPFRDLLRLLDRYPYQGQYKGGYVKINSPFIYITCEFHPEHYWKGNDLTQVVRRLSAITHMEQKCGTEVIGNSVQSLM